MCLHTTGVQLLDDRDHLQYSRFSSAASVPLVCGNFLLSDDLTLESDRS